MPLAVQTAMEGFKTGDFKEGQTVFVVGGAGGVGTLAVQLAKHFYEASLVVATTSTAKVEFVKSLGADKVVDYTKTRYEEIEDKFDLLYDTIGTIFTIFSLSYCILGELLRAILNMQKLAYKINLWLRSSLGLIPLHQI